MFPQGTCIDRFYFGSCCKLPEVIATNELGQGQAPDGIIPANLESGDLGNNIGQKPEPSAPADVIGKETYKLYPSQCKGLHF